MHTLLFITLMLFAFCVQATPQFTEQERDWIVKNPVVNYHFSPSWPLDFIEHDKHVGLSRSYLDQLEKESGLRFVVTQAPGQAEMIVALASALIPVAEGFEWQLSPRWLTSNTLVITTHEASHVGSLEQLYGKRVAVRANTWYESWLREYHPDIIVMPQDDVRAVFNQILAGEVEAGLGSDLVMRPLLHRNYSHKLVVATQIPEMIAGMYLGVKSEQPVLGSILTKTLAAIPASQTDKIFKRWIGDLQLGYPSAKVVIALYPIELSLILTLLLGLIWALRRALMHRRRAENSEARKSQFLAMMSHEIRTPMSAMIAALELLRLPCAPQQRKEYLELANNSSKNLLGLLNDILDHSKLSHQQMKLDKNCFSLSDMIATLVDIHRPVAKAKGVSLLVSACEFAQTAWIVTDEYRLRQVINNLLSNAIKFTEHGYVKLKLSMQPQDCCDDQLRIDVIDTGIGIPLAAQSTLFEAWTQGEHSETRRYDGSGLGLYISHQLVKLANGHLSCCSQPGQGATFTVVMPISRCEPPRYTVSTEHDLPRFIGGTSVLVVEDHPANQKMLAAQLNVLGCHSEIAGDGTTALSLLHHENYYDVILLDCHLPDIDGYTVAAKIRQFERMQGSVETPIVAISAMSGAEHQHLCLDHGMNALLTKPLSLAALAELLARWCPVQILQATELREAAGMSDEALHAAFLDDIAQFSAAYNQHDRQVMIYYIHRLHGAALMYQRQSLAHLSAEIEQELRSGAVQSVLMQEQWTAELRRCAALTAHP